jgi:hypothetical protein
MLRQATGFPVARKRICCEKGKGKNYDKTPAGKKNDIV